ncbi:unnamed protein product [Brachionus calyciflorus]|uniref:Integrase p58-like C-terminal domain-containing protein n=1 Tax=Brachionus calyciflorus TaxID=104777 RepID=A0A814C9Q5_9BILA|nr:unnamed protein product [Brachionus calyciflorus]
MYLLKQSKKKGVSKKLSHKCKGPYTITEMRGEHNYLIRPYSGGKKQLVHANRLKKCFRPEVNTRYQSYVEESEVVPCENRDEVADTVEPVHEIQVGIDHEISQLIRGRSSWYYNELGFESEDNFDDSVMASS